MNIENKQDYTAGIQLNNYIVRSYRNVIVVTKDATRRANKEYSYVLKQKTC